MPLQTRRDFTEATDNKESARVIVRWLLNTGRLQEYRVAERLARDTADTAGLEEGERDREEEGGSETEGEGLERGQVQPS